MTTIERLWNPFQTCSTSDNKPVELKFPGGDVKVGYFSSSQGRWVDKDGVPFQEGLYPSYWRAWDEPARVTPSTVGGEAHEETVREAAQLRTQLKIAKAELNFVFVKHGYQSTADALGALSPTIASEKEPVQASIDQRGPDVPGLGRDYR